MNKAFCGIAIRGIEVAFGSNPDFLLGGRTSASAERRHWSGEGSPLVKLRNSA
jgi:hypothetical protein